MQWIPSEQKEQPEQEPDDMTVVYMAGFYDGKNKYKPKREWQSLTDDEIKVWSKSQASAFAHVTEGAVQRGVSAAKQTMSVTVCETR